jgi:hypothetical protein
MITSCRRPATTLLYHFRREAVATSRFYFSPTLCGLVPVSRCRGHPHCSGNLDAGCIVISDGWCPLWRFPLKNRVRFSFVIYCAPSSMANIAKSLPGQARAWRGNLIRQEVTGNHRWVHRVCYTAHSGRGQSSAGRIFWLRRDNIRGAHDHLDIDSGSAADVRRGFGSRPLRAVALVA